MKLTKSFEQGVCLMAILATQAKAIPVSSHTLQRRLPTSMTYSQKLLRKLVVAGIVKSVPGNSGGFTLARPVGQISILEVVEALEGRIDSFPSTGLLVLSLPAKPAPTLTKPSLQPTRRYTASS